jgi:hypothetical protein
VRFDHVAAMQPHVVNLAQLKEDVDIDVRKILDLTDL